jgi:hypothetical protein
MSQEREDRSARMDELNLAATAPGQSRRATGSALGTAVKR